MYDQRVTAVVLNYRSTKLTIDCVNSLLEQSHPELNILIVDNDSGDGGLEWLKLAFESKKRVEVINSYRNGGYAYGNNVGMKYGEVRYKSKYFLIVNPDILLLQNNAVSSLVRVLEISPEIAGVQPLIKGEDGIIQGPYARPNLCFEVFSRLFPFVRFIRHRMMRRTNEVCEVEGYCFRVLGACFLVRAEDMDRVGMFDESTFMYFEECILAEKMLEIGKKFYYYPKVHALHMHKKEFGASGRLRLEWQKSMLYYFVNYQKQPVWLALLASKLFIAESRFRKVFRI